MIGRQTEPFKKFQSRPKPTVRYLAVRWIGGRPRYVIRGNRPRKRK